MRIQNGATVQSPSPLSTQLFQKTMKAVSKVSKVSNIVQVNKGQKIVCYAENANTTVFLARIYRVL